VHASREATIYNLFPRLAGPPAAWPAHLERAAAMGFRWLYLNPVFYPGFSGSVYAVKRFDRLDPVVFGDAGLDALAGLLERAKRLGLRPMIDLVVNHTAKDSDLVAAHPEWYVRAEDGTVRSPFAIDPADARRTTVWGDLAELDHEGTSDPAGLAAFVDGVVDACLDVGFEGFRCDAAYKVPAATWRRVIDRVRRRLPSALVVAETLGARPAEMEGLEGAGFDFVMNSSKYWAFDAPWCLDQHEAWQTIAPSMAFPESHDTPRLAAETGGLIQVQKQRLLFAAVFSEGLLVPVGFELGFTRRIDVVHTRAADWESPSFDLRGFVARVLELKRSVPAFATEGHFEALTPLDRPTLLLEKSAGDDVAVLLINKDWRARQRVDLGPAFERVGRAPALIRPCLDAAAAVGPTTAPGGTLDLEPAEIALLRP
jgi:starch synthase (maltosyl-transferring)